MTTSSTTSSPSASTANDPVLLKTFHDGKIVIVGVYQNGEKKIVELNKICQKRMFKDLLIAEFVFRKRIKRFFGQAILTPPVENLLTELAVIYSAKNDPTPEGEERRAIELQEEEERMDRKSERWYYR